MPDFDAKMHQNRFRLGLRSRPRWGSLQRSPRPPSWFRGCLLLREGRGEGGKERGGGGLPIRNSWLRAWVRARVRNMDKVWVAVRTFAMPAPSLWRTGIHFSVEIRNRGVYPP